MEPGAPGAWPSRREVEVAVGRAFAEGRPTRDDLIAAALCSAARPAVVHLLRGLPQRRYRDLGEVWTALPDLAEHANEVQT